MAVPVVLRTERIVPRPFQRADVDPVYAYARDPEWSRYLIAVQREFSGPPPNDS